MISHRYTSYRQSPISITDVLSLTLAFVHDEGALDSDHAHSHGEPEEEQAEKRPRPSLYPSPRYKSKLELEVMEKCLKRWKEELAQDIEGMSVLALH